MTITPERLVLDTDIVFTCSKNSLKKLISFYA